MLDIDVRYVRVNACCKGMDADPIVNDTNRSVRGSTFHVFQRHLAIRGGFLSFPATSLDGCVLFLISGVCHDRFGYDEIFISTGVRLFLSESSLPAP